MAAASGSAYQVFPLVTLTAVQPFFFFQGGGPSVSSEQLDLRWNRRYAAL